MSTGLDRSVRLRVRAEFTQVQDRGRRVATRYLTLLAMPNSLNRDRLGIIASRRLGGAVVRNRAKRRVRELFRQQEPDAPATRGLVSLDMVIIPRREVASIAFSLLEQDFRTALGRLDRARVR